MSELGSAAFKRYSTNELKMPPAEARDRFPKLITISAGTYKFSLTAAFQKALDDCERAVATSRDQMPAQPQGTG